MERRYRVSLPSRRRKRTIGISLLVLCVQLSAVEWTYRMRLELFYCESPVCLAQHPTDKIFRLSAEMHVVREKEVASPFDNLAIDIVCVFGAEGRIACWSAEYLGRQVDHVPTRHSNIIAPRDHQSHSFPYPCCRKISGEIYLVSLSPARG
jgi:hypothetical protein